MSLNDVEIRAMVSFGVYPDGEELTSGTKFTFNEIPIERPQLFIAMVFSMSNLISKVDIAVASLLVTREWFDNVEKTPEFREIKKQLKKDGIESEGLYIYIIPVEKAEAKLCVFDGGDV